MNKKTLTCVFDIDDIKDIEIVEKLMTDTSSDSDGHCQIIDITESSDTYV